MKDHTLITVTGKLSTVLDAQEFISALKESVKKDHKIVLDLSASTFLNSSVLGILASESLRFKKAGGRIVILNPNEYVLESLELFSLERIIPFISDVSEIKEAFDRHLPD